MKAFFACVVVVGLGVILPLAAQSAEKPYDYVVIGSGAGGGPLAARLAEEGFRVLVLEAGGEIPEPKTAEARMADKEYFAPLMHAAATESDKTSWRFFVKHNAHLDARDSKISKTHDGLFYPRASTVGGCTAHHAMITVAAQDSDWDYIQSVADDKSWGAEKMRRYFQRVEQCRYGAGSGIAPLRPVGWLWNFLTSGQPNPGRHGYNGWLPVDRAPLLLFKDDLSLGGSTARSFLDIACEEKTAKRPRRPFLWDFDPNDWRTLHQSPTGFIRVPVSINSGRRAGTRERLLAVREKHPDRLVISTDSFATRLLLAPGREPREDAVVRGVEYRLGKRLYEADPEAEKHPGAAQDRRDAAKIVRVYPKREVIVSCGAFNTPQLLMLSGIGPADQLRSIEAANGKPFPVRVVREGVGRNLQDRYEVALTIERHDAKTGADRDWPILNGVTAGQGRELKGDRVVDAVPRFTGPDPKLDSWVRHPNGLNLYGVNGGIGAVIWKTSRSRGPDPDLFMFSTPGWFRGYAENWSKEILQQHNWLTWVILKAHTKNTGRVTLNATLPASPYVRPVIDFKNFAGGDVDDLDLQAVVEGLQFCKKLVEPELKHGATRYWPQQAKYSWDDDGKGFREYARNEAWGHHASCTCPIGPDPRGPEAKKFGYVPVLDGRFRVHGVTNLRVVDASVFPRIPGYFILMPTYMISEKAAEVIAEDARK
jgi:choline dehydrogenase-like flavoprotein